MKTPNTDEARPKYYIHHICGVFLQGFDKYVMTKRADGWYAIMESGGETFVHEPDYYGFNHAVENGSWVKTTLEKAFGGKE